MLYDKPKDITYTQMAMDIDKMMYSDDCNDELMFEYLFHLAYILAVKARFFNSKTYYEDYAVFTATRVFLRIKNEKQFKLNEDGSPKMPKLKSSLNYLKSVLYPCKVTFEQQDYVQTSIKVDELELDTSLGYTFSNMLSDTVDGLLKVEVDCYFDDICSTIKSFLKSIPYTGVEWTNIYISCLLSFLNSITLSDGEVARLRSFKRKVDENSLYNKFNTLDNVVLYHLDSSMHDYIAILLVSIKKIISRDLTELIQSSFDTNSISPYFVWREINSKYSQEEFEG